MCKQTDKVETFTSQELPKNDVFFMSLFSLANDALLVRRLKGVWLTSRDLKFKKKDL